ncbi:GPO family capsid scaffolding protein [Marinobacterium iners]|uniref:Phage capsid scaffolding protein (GPO) serine peptidase n=1 Tax=Marinobacterium iners DSM 11526 TaxID=1122198 RepID=A0A1H3ZW98_9GAMM|nr:GPO family capsid scaffolding protein [Marinobacterium iners]SEA27564.1 Phage capsid scaffolding protein (GPO) serine peptidase [Marinobacterium iners DSM 11526]
MAKKALKSKWFRVGVEGDTTDGRKIEAAWLTQMAANYNPEKYGARVNCEHVRGMAPDSSFGAFGDVTALKTETIKIDGEDKVALYAQITPNDDLIALNKKRKKVYTSMEIDHNFADKGEAYLVGLAVTDSPASLGTEMLEFAATQAEKNPLNARKQKPENVFSAAREVELEFEDNTSLLTRVKEMLSRNEGQRTQKDGEFSEAIEAIAGELASLKDQFSKLSDGGDSSALQQLQTDLKAARDDLTELKQKLDNTPNFTQRPAASGGKGEQVTDC